MASIFCLTNTFLALTDTILQNTRFSIDTMLKCHRRYGIYRKSRSDSVKQTGKRKRTNNKAQTIVIELDPLEAKKKVQEVNERVNTLLTELNTKIKVSNATTTISF